MKRFAEWYVFRLKRYWIPGVQEAMKMAGNMVLVVLLCWLWVPVLLGLWVDEWLEKKASEGDNDWKEGVQ